MDQLITEIYQTTLKMQTALKAENLEELETLLEKRGLMMLKVEAFKSENPGFEYNTELKAKLAKTFQLDQSLLPKMEELKEQSSTELAKIKKKKQVSQKYAPYTKQNYGAFIDTNK